MQVLLGIGAAGAAIVAFAWWAKRRWDTVDTYFEREYQDPPISDASGWSGGTRL